MSAADKTRLAGLRQELVFAEAKGRATDNIVADIEATEARIAASPVAAPVVAVGAGVTSPDEARLVALQRERVLAETKGRDIAGIVADIAATEERVNATKPPEAEEAPVETATEEPPETADIKRGRGKATKA